MVRTARGAVAQVRRGVHTASVRASRCSRRGAALHPRRVAAEAAPVEMIAGYISAVPVEHHELAGALPTPRARRAELRQSRQSRLVDRWRRDARLNHGWNCRGTEAVVRLWRCGAPNVVRSGISALAPTDRNRATGRDPAWRRACPRRNGATCT